MKKYITLILLLAATIAVTAFASPRHQLDADVSIDPRGHNVVSPLWPGTPYTGVFVQTPPEEVSVDPPSPGMYIRWFSDLRRPWRTYVARESQVLDYAHEVYRAALIDGSRLVMDYEQGPYRVYHVAIRYSGTEYYQAKIIVPSAQWERLGAPLVPVADSLRIDPR